MSDLSEPCLLFCVIFTLVLLTGLSPIPYVQYFMIIIYIMIGDL